MKATSLGNHECGAVYNNSVFMSLVEVAVNVYRGRCV